MQKSTTRIPRKQSGRGWWAHDVVYNRCQQFGICSLYQYPGGCQRGAKCPFKHDRLPGNLVIDGKVYNTRSMAPGETFPKSLQPPARPRKKAKTEPAQWYDDEVAPTSSGSTAAPGVGPPPKLTLPSAVESPVHAAAPSPKPLVCSFTSPRQELAKLKRDMDRLQRRAASIEEAALNEESHLDSQTTARCYRYEYLTHPRKQMVGTNAYHVRYCAVKPHDLGYNDQAVEKRSQAQREAHDDLYTALIEAMANESCFRCRQCSRNLRKAEDMMPCVRCYSVLYCSASCALADAPMHSFGCFYHPGYHLRCEQAAMGRPVHRQREVQDCDYLAPSSSEPSSSDPNPALLSTPARPARTASSGTTTPVRVSRSPAGTVDPAAPGTPIPSYTDTQIALETQAYNYAWSQVLPDGANASELKALRGYSDGAAERSALVAQLRAERSTERTNALAVALAAEQINVLSADSTAQPDPDRLEITFGLSVALSRTPAYKTERASVIAANEALEYALAHES